ALVVVEKEAFIEPPKPSRSLADRERRVNPARDRDRVVDVGRRPLFRPVLQAGHVGLPDLLVPLASVDVGRPRVGHLRVVLVDPENVEGLPGLLILPEPVAIVVAVAGKASLSAPRLHRRVRKAATIQRISAVRMRGHQRAGRRGVAPSMVPFVHFGRDDLDPCGLELRTSHLHPSRHLFGSERRRIELSDTWRIRARRKIRDIPDRHGVKPLNLRKFGDVLRKRIEALFEQEATVLSVAVALATCGSAKDRPDDLCAFGLRLGDERPDESAGRTHAHAQDGQADCVSSGGTEELVDRQDLVARCPSAVDTEPLNGLARRVQLDGHPTWGAATRTVAVRAAWTAAVRAARTVAVRAARAASARATGSVATRAP